jgi:hypothetical protein
MFLKLAIKYLVEKVGKEAREASEEDGGGDPEDILTFPDGPSIIDDQNNNIFCPPTSETFHFPV